MCNRPLTCTNGQGPLLAKQLKQAVEAGRKSVVAAKQAAVNTAKFLDKHKATIVGVVAGADTLHAGPGDDRMRGGAGAPDICDGEEGTDTADAACETPTVP